jgi:conjugative transfer region protein (TIGR03750 family)
MPSENDSYVRSTCERINEEPIIIRGMTSSELRVAMIVTFIIWLPLSITLGIAVGRPMMGLGLVGVGGIVSILFIGTVFQKVKRNKPDGYYQQLVTISLSKTGLKKSPFLKYSGSWSVGRKS